MPFFRLEIFDSNGTIKDKLHVNLSVPTVELALNDSYVQRVKKDASLRGLAFRVKLEEN